MPNIQLTTFIEAPVQVCFDLARNVDIHMKSASKSRERVVNGRSTGLCELGDVITWEGIHFGVRQKLTIRIIKMEPYLSFEDEMIKGAFKLMKHNHTFEVHKNGTKMIDDFVYKAPLGFLGYITEKLILTRYLKNFLLERNKFIKATAENM